MKQLKKYYDVKLLELKKLQKIYTDSIQNIIDTTETINFLKHNKNNSFKSSIEILENKLIELKSTNLKLSDKYYNYIDYLRDIEKYLNERSRLYNLDNVNSIIFGG